jgi:hypothetical protein
MPQVLLAVYDLTNGMASMMSEGILGQRIEGIWHTGIRAFGKEWFFGGGIQSLPIGVFEQTRGLNPTRIDVMGDTFKTEADLQAHVGTLSSRFTAATYNLMSNNCNNFSDEVCKFLCGHGITDDIINQAELIFNTPNGAMFRPIMESMTSQINGFPHTTGSTFDPFGGRGTTAQTSSAQVGWSGQGQGGYSSASASSSVGGNNFNLLGSTQSAATVRADGTSNVVTQGTVVSTAASIVRASLDDAYLISAAVSGYEAMGARLLKVLGDGAEGTEAVKEVMSVLATVAAGQTQTICNFLPDHYSTLVKIATENGAAQSAALFLLRLMVNLPSSQLPADTVDAVIRPLSTMLRAVGSDNMAFPAPFKNVSGLVFALIVLSNWTSEAREAEYRASAGLEEGLVDLSMAFLHSERAEVRQISSALVHNLCLRRTGSSSSSSGSWPTGEGEGREVHFHAVQILCGVLEGVHEEKDVLVRKRRLATALRIVRHWSTEGNTIGSNGNPAAQMVLDLGFDGFIALAGQEAGAQSRTGGRDDPSSEATVCKELLGYLRLTVVATAGSTPVVPGYVVPRS